MRGLSLALLTSLAISTSASAQVPFAGKTFDEWCLTLKEHPEKRFRIAATKVLSVKYGPKTDGVLRTMFDSLQKEKEAEVRVEIVHALAGMDPETRGVVDALGDALKSDKAGEVREAAAKGLAEKFSPVARSYVMVLADALQDPHVPTRTNAAEALRNMDKNASLAFDKLVVVVKDPKSERFTRQFALQAVMNIAGDQAGTASLLAGIVQEKGTHPALRTTALHAMGKLSNGLNEAVEVLGASLKDPDVEIRRAAAISLAKHGSRAKPVWLLVVEGMKDGDNTVRFQLIRVLAEMSREEPDALKLLADAALKDQNVENRLAAVGELQNLGLGAREVLPTLEKIAEEDIRLSVREAAKKAIEKVKGN